MRSTIETNERAINNLLKTHYYRIDYRRLKKIIIEMAEKMNLGFKSSNDDYHEIICENNDQFMSFRITMISIEETALDIFMDSYKAFGGFHNSSILKQIYAYLMKECSFVGLALNRK